MLICCASASATVETRDSMGLLFGTISSVLQRTIVPERALPEVGALGSITDLVAFVLNSDALTCGCVFDTNKRQGKPPCRLGIPLLEKWMSPLGVRLRGVDLSLWKDRCR